MTKFVKQRSHFVQTQQAGVCLREVAAVQNYRVFEFVHVRLVAKTGHPGAAAFRRAHEEVEHEIADQTAIGFVHLIDLYVRVIPGQICARLETDAVQLVGHLECTVANILQTEVGFDFFFVQIEPLFADFFGVIPPVPGFRLKIAAFCLNAGLYVCGFGGHLVLTGLPYTIEQVRYGAWGFCHAVVEHEVAVIGKAEQPGFFSAQCDDLADQRMIVSAAYTAAGVCAIELFTQFSILSVLQEGGDR